MDQAVDIKRKWKNKLIYLASRENINIQLWDKTEAIRSKISRDKLGNMFIPLDGIEKEQSNSSVNSSLTSYEGY